MEANVRGIWSSLLGVLVLLLLAAAAQAQEAIEKLEAIAPGGVVETLSPQAFEVLRWVENHAAGENEPKWRQETVEAIAVYRVAQQYYVQIPAATSQPAGETAASVWLAGWVASGNRINCSPTTYSSLDALVSESSYPRLPAMPGKWKVREVAQMPTAPIRLASDGAGGSLFVLAQNGDVWKVETASGKLTQVLKHADYLPHGGDALGMTLDPERGQLYIVVNRRDTQARPQQNHVTIFRTTSMQCGLPAEPRPWLQTSYPYGVNTFNHGVSYIAFGPDGMLYVNSGSRTDHGELGEEPGIARIPGGETPETACIWRLDPREEVPKIEIFARGIRNAFGFCWDDRGRMLATENGPNADAPEELNLIEQGRHYGFPYQFSDWEEKAYPDQPDTPPMLEEAMTLPIINDGPDGMGPQEKAASTLEAHSCPAGVVYLDDTFPEAQRGTFLVVRYGNFIGPRDTGFDVLQVRLEDAPRDDGRHHATVETFLAPVARPLDIHLSGGRIYICEHTRQTNNSGPQLPGRIIEVSVEE